MDEPEECSRSNTELPSVPQQYLLRDLAPRPRTLWDIITTTAEMHPDAAALDDGEIITYSELIHEVEAWAAELHANGVRRGDRIGIRMTSGKRELYLAILATLAAGAALLLAVPAGAPIAAIFGTRCAQSGAAVASTISCMSKDCTTSARKCRS